MKPIYSREMYMSGTVSHDEYYAQFVTNEIRQAVFDAFSARQLREAGEYFNGIPLHRWDMLGRQFHYQIATDLRAAGDFLSSAGVVCILKRAAKEILEIHP